MSQLSPGSDGRWSRLMRRSPRSRHVGVSAPHGMSGADATSGGGPRISAALRRWCWPAWEAPYQQQDDGRSSSCRLMLPTQGERFDGSDQATTKIVAQTRRLSLIKPMALGDIGFGIGGNADDHWPSCIKRAFASDHAEIVAWPSSRRRNSICTRRGAGHETTRVSAESARKRNRPSF